LDGIYTLEKISKESEEYYWPIIEILTAYVRKHSSSDSQLKETSLKIEPISMNIQANESSKSEVSKIRTVSLDIQAILDVIAKRKYSFKSGEIDRLNLSRTDLRNTNLRDVDLSGADLSRAHLEGAYLSGAYLNGANLSGAYLDGVHLVKGPTLETLSLELLNFLEHILKGLTLKELTLKKLTLKKPNIYHLISFPK